MHPLVQSAIDAANRGENNKALELCKQALAANPNDVDAWLVVAAVVEQPERKRQCLNRVLALDPTNQIARDELLEMDRAALGGVSASSPEPAPQSSSSYPTYTSAFETEPTSEPEYPSSAFSDDPASSSTFESQPPEPVPSQPQSQAAPRSSSARPRQEKPLVFRYPLFWRIFMFIGVLFFACAGLFSAVENILYSLIFFAFALGAGIVAMIYLSKVEVSEAGIRASSVLGSSQVKWSDIKSMKSGGMNQELELVKSNGQVVKVSNQVSGYSRIVEILRQKRPDLFGMAANAASGSEPASAGSYGSSVSAPAFSGVKKFEKSFLRRYGVYLLILPLCVISVGAALTDAENRVIASLFGVFCVVMLFLPLFQVHGIKVEPNRLTLETLFEEKTFSARQIKDIKMKSVRGRYGTVSHFVEVIPTEGKKYSLNGFSVGEEVLYGFLTNWWNAYQNR